MGFLNIKFLLIIGFFLFFYTGCCPSNDKITVNIQILSQSTQQPIPNIKVTILQKVPLLSLKKSRKILISKTDSLGLISFKGKQNISYSLWIEDENNNFTTENLIVNDIVNDTIIYDINMH